MGYVDGMSLYEYVKSGPADGLDPSGMIQYVTRNADILAADAALRQSAVGSKLIAEIEFLERSECTPVVVNIVAKRSDNSGTREGRFIEWANLPQDVEFVSSKWIHVRINPLQQLGYDPERWTLNWLQNTGPGDQDVELGTPLDELLYHELTHAKRYLDKTHIGGPVEEATVTALTNAYITSKGRPARFSHRTTDGQNRYGNELLEAIKAMGEEYRPQWPLLSEPVYPGI